MEILLETLPEASSFRIICSGPNLWLEELACTVTLAFHDDVEIGWWATVECEWDAASSTWLGMISGAAPPSQLVEVTDCRIAGERVQVSPETRYHLLVSNSTRIVTGVAAAAEASGRFEAREALYRKAICSPDGNTSRRFAAIIAADRLKINGVHRVPGIELLELTQATLGTDLAGVLGVVSPQLGYAIDMPVERWLPHIHLINDDVGVVLAVMRDIRAGDYESASTTALNAVELLLDLEGALRDSRARLRGGAFFSITEAGEIADWAPWIASRPYHGNLLEGFVAGEDPRALLNAWSAAQTNSQAQLWLSLYGDALAEYRLDFRFFRCFGLLEAIAKEVVGDSQPLVHVDGRPILDDMGKSVTTKSARGKVSFLLQQILGDPLPMDFTYEALNLWVKVRNSVAHEGALLRPDGPVGRRQTECYVKLAELTPTDSVEEGLRILDITITRAVKATLLAALHGRLGTSIEAE